MSFINYPAVFHNENNSWWVEFPDLEGCFSDGETLEMAYDNSKFALGFYLDKDNDKYERKIKEPSNILEIMQKYAGETVMLVPYDSIEYARLYKTKAVKKTLTIPEWMSDFAAIENISLSSLLQEALLNKIREKNK